MVWALPMQFSVPLTRESAESQRNDRVADEGAQSEVIPNLDVSQTGQNEDVLNLEVSKVSRATLSPRLVSQNWAGSLMRSHKA